MSEKEGFLNALSGNPCDRPPFIVPGALISEPLAAALTQGGFRLEKLRNDPYALAELSLFMRKEAGIENAGMPFLMRLESCSYNGEPDEVFSGLKPLEFIYPLDDVSDYKGLSQKKEPLGLGLDTIRILSSKVKDAPLIADVCGPVSLAASLLDGKTLLKSMAKDPFGTHGLLEFLSKNTLDYAIALKQNGADAVFISDNFSTALTLGKGFFREYSLRHLNAVCDGLREAGCYSMVHLCSDVTGLAEEIQDLRADCVSIDSETPIHVLMAALPGRKIMGNIKAAAFFGTSSVGARCIVPLQNENLPRVIAPSCGITREARQEVSAVGARCIVPLLKGNLPDIIGPSCGITRVVGARCIVPLQAFSEVKDILSVKAKR